MHILGDYISALTLRGELRPEKNLIVKTKNLAYDVFSCCF